MFIPFNLTAYSNPPLAPVLTPNTRRPLLNSEDRTPTNRALAEEYPFLKYVSVANVPKCRVQAENARVLPE
jgi:hypothetical protein